MLILSPRLRLRGFLFVGLTVLCDGGSEFPGINNLQRRYLGKVELCYNKSGSVIERKLNGTKC